MSRLSSHRANAPDMTKPRKLKGPKNKSWRKGEPPIVVQPCRVALNEAISRMEYGRADRICQKKQRPIYARLSKPQLLDYLRWV